jgi:hypothetical protein
VIVKRGEDVPEWADPAILAALANAGMILPIGSPPPVADLGAPALPNPEVLAQVFTPGAVAQPDGTTAETTTVVERPKDSDVKPMWEAYAESIGVDRAEAESLTKPKLIERVTAREAELSSAA